MAEYTGFFDGPQLYGQEEFARYFDNIYESGVSIFENNNLSFDVSASSTGVNVNKGYAIVKGFYIYNDEVKSIKITRDSNYSRFDRIVLRLDLSSRKVEIKHILGTLGSSPIAPSLIRNSINYDIGLAIVKVPKEGAFIVEDTRTDKGVCGAIRPKNLTEFNQMLNNFKDRFNDWFNNLQGQGWRNIYIQSNKPSTNLEGSLWKKPI